MDKHPFVSVCMITYGHEKFIRKAMTGVLDQHANFSFELVIANDCSPDGTDKIIQDVINEHPQGHLVRYYNHDENLGMMKNFAFVLNAASGKYIALCEGDDYWFDNKKLQMQVDFLESHPDFMLVGHNAKFNKKNIEEENVVRKVTSDFIDVTTRDLIKKNPFVSSMVTFCNIGFEEIMSILDNFIVGDKALFTLLSFSGKGRMYAQPVGYYRKHDHSVTSKNRIDYKAFRDDLVNRINHAEYWNSYANNRFESEMNEVRTYRSKVLTSMALRNKDLITAVKYSRFVNLDDFKKSRAHLLVKFLKSTSRLLYRNSN